jgi:hypothetical protein
VSDMDAALEARADFKADPVAKRAQALMERAARREEAASIIQATWRHGNERHGNEHGNERPTKVDFVEDPKGDPPVPLAAPSESKRRSETTGSTLGATTWLAAALTAALACYYARAWDTAAFFIAFVACAAYLPFYLSPAHRRGRAYSRSTAMWRGWRFLWTRVLGMPLAEVRLHDPEALSDPTKQRIFGSHPHGVGSLHHMGVIMCPATCEDGKSFESASVGSGRRELAATIIFRIPLVRELALSLGCCDASREVASRVLRDGSSVGVMVGGEQEQLLSQRGRRHVVYASQRKGIIKLALRHGVPICPMYCFGETDCYHSSTFLLPARQWVAKKFGLAVTLAYGRSPLLPFLPIPTRLVLVVGSPIPTEKVAEPTPAEVDRLHALYLAGLREVFETHKAGLGYADAELVVL